MNSLMQMFSFTGLRAIALTLALTVGTGTDLSAIMIQHVLPNVGGTAVVPGNDSDAVPDLEFKPVMPPSDTIDIELVPLSLISISPVLLDITGASQGAGGFLGGDITTFNGFLQLHITGSMDLAGFDRTIIVPLSPGIESHSAARTPMDAVQSFDTELDELFGLVLGDPDFDVLDISAGRSFGLDPSTGHTTLTRLGAVGTDFVVESFFDVFFEITINGAPGSVLEGLGGTFRPEDSIRLGLNEMNVIPEPETYLLMGSFIAAIAVLHRRRRSAI